MRFVKHPAQILLFCVLLTAYNRNTVYKCLTPFLIFPESLSFCFPNFRNVSLCKTCGEDIPALLSEEDPVPVFNELKFTQLGVLAVSSPQVGLHTSMTLSDTL